ncbi:MAG: phosphate transport system substrate-binding protein, partial [Nocardioidaceae bacterium]|nr:phosphate transport system substrate-binding protein [Nocardioidaceae bacterium]
KLKAADPLVDLTDRDVRSCNNPTFDGHDLNKNKLAQIAPQPAACDKDGEGPCGTDTGTNEPSTDDPSVPTDTGSGAPASDPGGGGAPPGTAPTDTGPVVDPDTGEVSTPAPVDPAAGGAATGQQPADFPAPTELAAARPADTSTFGWVAAALLLALVLMPGLLVSSLRRRPRRRGAP